MNCPHCGICLDAPKGGTARWGLLFGHPFTSCMELQIEEDRFQCRECNGEWVGDRRQKDSKQ